jgi:hypothetical protein
MPPAPPHPAAGRGRSWCGCGTGRASDRWNRAAGNPQTAARARAGTWPGAGGHARSVLGLGVDRPGEQVVPVVLAEVRVGVEPEVGVEALGAVRVVVVARPLDPAGITELVVAHAGVVAWAALGAEPAVVDPVAGTAAHADHLTAGHGDVQPAAVGAQHARRRHPTVDLVWCGPAGEEGVHPDRPRGPRPVGGPGSPRLRDPVGGLAPPASRPNYLPGLGQRAAGPAAGPTPGRGAGRRVLATLSRVLPAGAQVSTASAQVGCGAEPTSRSRRR